MYAPEAMELLATTPATVSVLSIDAWRNAEGGWNWNNWHKVGTIDPAICDKPARAILRTLRECGYLSAQSAGRCAVEDDGYNVVIKNRGTDEPIFAIAYGEAQ